MDEDHSAQKSAAKASTPDFAELAKKIELNPQNSINIVLKGAPGSGKTSTYFRYDLNAFYPNGEYPTIEDRRLKSIQVHAQHYMVQVLDVPEEVQQLPHYRALVQGWYCTFDVTDPHSYAQLRDYLAAHCERHLPLVIVGTKADLVRAVTPAQGAELAAHYDAQYFDTSAKDAFNVAQAFTALVTRVVEHELTRRYAEQSQGRGDKTRRCIVA